MILLNQQWLRLLLKPVTDIGVGRSTEGYIYNKLDDEERDKQYIERFGIHPIFSKIKTVTGKRESRMKKKS